MTEKGVRFTPVQNRKRGVTGWEHLRGKHLKTTSEWPQSGPVTPLSSERSRVSLCKRLFEGTFMLYQFFREIKSDTNKGGTAGNI